MPLEEGAEEKNRMSEQQKAAGKKVIRNSRGMEEIGESRKERNRDKEMKMREGEKRKMK